VFAVDQSDQPHTCECNQNNRRSQIEEEIQKLVVGGTADQDVGRITAMDIFRKVIKA